MTPTTAVPVQQPTDFPWPNVQLVESDGEPMDTPWHRDAMNLLIEQVRWQLRDRQDYFVGGNMFIYFNLEQARNRDFRGPDFFFVDGARPNEHRLWWAIWEEGGKYPDVIIELLSPTTAVEDRTTKKQMYERTFRTGEYFLYDPTARQLDGWRLINRRYQRIEPDARGWLWCDQLKLWLGVWDGPYQNRPDVWLRFHDTEGKVVPLFAEAEKQRTEAEQQRAEAEKQRAAQLEAEVARLRAMIEEKKANGADPA